MTKSNLKK